MGADLFERLRSRDEATWRALHEHEFPLLYRLALGMGADPDLAEDCASESFARLIRALPKLRLGSPSDLRGWLITVCRNYLRDHLRRSRRTQRAPLADADRPAPDVDPLTRIAVSAALAALPERQREVLVMRFVLGMSTREIAELDRRGVKAIESLQHRALLKLRGSLPADLA